MILCQRDAKWLNIKLGNSPYSLGQSGCFVTVIAEIIGATPDIVNRMLLENGGFAKDVNGYSDLVDWSSISRIFHGITTRYISPYNNTDVLQNLASGNSILCHVTGKPIGGTGIHAVRYVGGGRLHDPWTGQDRPTSDFGVPYSYVIFSGKWQVGQNNSEMHTYQMPQSVFTDIVTKATNLDNLLTELEFSPNIGTEPDSYKRILAYIQDFITIEVNKRAPVNQPSQPPLNTRGEDVLPNQPKSVWKKDVLQILRDILISVKGGKTV